MVLFSFLNEAEQAGVLALASRAMSVCFARGTGWSGARCVFYLLVEFESCKYIVSLGLVAHEGGVPIVDQGQGVEVILFDSNCLVLWP